MNGNLAVKLIPADKASCQILDRGKLLELLQRGDPTFTQIEADALYDAADKNQNGAIDYSAFVDSLLCPNGHERAPLPTCSPVVSPSWPVAEQTHGKKTSAAAVAALNNVLDAAGASLADGLRQDIQYAVDVLLSLQVDREDQNQDLECEELFDSLEDELDDDTREWLMGFTHKKTDKAKTFKQIATTVKLAVRWGAMCSPRTSESRRRDLNRSLPKGMTQAGPIKEELDKIDSWSEFDIFHLASLTNGLPLQFVGLRVLQNQGLIEQFNLNIMRVQTFLVEIEKLYVKENPYHNNVHAADVVQATHVLLSQPCLKDKFSELEILAAILAAIVHDTSHPGLTNDFQVKSGNENAMLWNDRSVNENMHACYGLRMFENEACNWAEVLSKEQYSSVRKIVIDIVLATDMAHHFAHINAFKDLCGKHGYDVASWPDKTPALELIVHSADISNCTRPMEIASQWADNVLAEFFAQGDREKAMGRQASPLCDRDSVAKPASQVGFVQFIVKPLYETLFTIITEFQEPMDNLLKYHKYWNEVNNKDKTVRISRKTQRLSPRTSQRPGATSTSLKPGGAASPKVPRSSALTVPKA